MTSLLIAHPDTPFVAPYINPSAAANAYKREYNLIAGDRATMFELAAAGTSWSITFGLGSQTRAADHLILARADILQTIGVTTVTLAYSDDDSSYSTAYTNASFASATLYGPDGNDFIATFAATATHPYWKVTYSGSSCYMTHSKCYFGMMFDMGVEPSFSFERLPGKEGVFVADSGAQFTVRTEQPRYTFDLVWEHVSDLKTAAFFEKIDRYKHRNPVFLYTGSVHAVLDNQRLVNCELIDAKTAYVQADWNVITATFQEVLG